MNKNEIVVRGKVNEITLTETVQPGTAGRPTQKLIRGKVEIRCDIDGKEIFIPFYQYTYEFTKAGKPNSAFTGLQTVMREYVSVAECGSVENATTVEVIVASMSENIYMAPNGTNLVHTTEMRAMYFDRVDNPSLKDAASFLVDAYILGVEKELDSYDAETGRLKVVAAMPGYNRADVLTYYVESKEAIDHISKSWSAGTSVQMAGRINFTVDTVTTEIPTDFGAPVMEQTTSRVYELIVDAGSQLPVPFEQESIEGGLAKRKAYMEEKRNYKPKPSKPATPQTTSATVDSFLDEMGF